MNWRTHSSPPSFLSDERCQIVDFDGGVHVTITASGPEDRLRDAAKDADHLRPPMGSSVSTSTGSTTPTVTDADRIYNEKQTDISALDIHATHQSKNSRSWHHVLLHPFSSSLHPRKNQPSNHNITGTARKRKLARAETFLHATPTASPPKRSFRILRGTTWVDPSDANPPAFTPEGKLPMMEKSYKQWLHQHHLQGALTDETAQNRKHKDSESHCAVCAAYPELQQCWRDTPSSSSSPAPTPAESRPHWTAAFRAIKRFYPNRKTSPRTPQPTFRVWHWYGDDISTNRGRWVDCGPSVLITEGPLDAEEARYRRQIEASWRSDCQRRRQSRGPFCGGPVPLWVPAVFVASLPVLVPVAVGMVVYDKVVEAGGRWCRLGRQRWGKVKECWLLRQRRTRSRKRKAMPSFRVWSRSVFEWRDGALRLGRGGWVDCGPSVVLLSDTTLEEYSERAAAAAAAAEVEAPNEADAAWRRLQWGRSWSESPNPHLAPSEGGPVIRWEPVVFVVQELSCALGPAVGSVYTRGEHVHVGECYVDELSRDGLCGDGKEKSCGFE